ncbi:hypothetical protein MMC20_007982 [Loxospora ochrophaea]|nr:hypothetical protein [Loxospora ochrophaea]
MQWANAWACWCCTFAPLLCTFSNASIAPEAQRPLQHSQHSTLTSPLFTLHRELVEIQSISGDEFNIGSYLATYLANRSFHAELQHVEPLRASEQGHVLPCDKPKRFNLLAYPGQKRNTRILVSSHMDTVPPYWPYEVRNHNDIWGRGSVDAKGSVATQIIAVEELLAAGDIGRDDVSLLFVVDEEVGGIHGMKRANDLGLQWEAVIFGEPTELKLASGHKGMASFTVKAHGKAAHSGYPWLGESANSMLIPALAALDDLEFPSSEKYGNTTLNIGTMSGGVAGNVLAEEAAASVTMRIATGTREDALKIVTDAIKNVDERLEVETSSAGYGPIDIDSDVEGKTWPWRKPFMPSYSQIGFDTITVNYGTDIPNLHGDHKRYLYGPGSILVAHSDHEHVKASDLEQAVEGYKRLILNALEP